MVPSTHQHQHQHQHTGPEKFNENSRRQHCPPHRHGSSRGSLVAAAARKSLQFEQEKGTKKRTLHHQVLHRNFVKWLMQTHLHGVAKHKVQVRGMTRSFNVTNSVTVLQQDDVVEVHEAQAEAADLSPSADPSSEGDLGDQGDGIPENYTEADAEADFFFCVRAADDEVDGSTSSDFDGCLAALATSTDTDADAGVSMGLATAATPHNNNLGLDDLTDLDDLFGNEELDEETGTPAPPTELPAAPRHRQLLRRRSGSAHAYKAHTPTSCTLKKQASTRRQRLPGCSSYSSFTKLSCRAS